MRGEDIADFAITQANDLFEEIDVCAGVALARDEHNRRVKPADLAPVRDAPGENIGKLRERQAINRVIVVNDHGQRIDRHDKLDRLDPVGAGCVDFVRLDGA